MGQFLIRTVIEIVVLCLLAINVFVAKSYNTTYSLAVLLLFIVASYFLFKGKKTKNRKLGDTIYIIAGLAIIYQGFMYLLGFKTGFNTSYNSIFKNYIDAFTWIKVFAIVILSEVLRSNLTSIEYKQKIRNSIHNTLTVLIFILFDVTICTKVYDLTIFTQLYEFLALTIVQSAAKNIFLCHSIKKYGIWPGIIYRIIMDLHIYLLPVVPAINTYIEGIALLLIPYMIYTTINGVNERKGLVPSKSRKKDSKIVTAITYILFAVLVVLVSREFDYCMIAIGSGSMSDTINKGDAIIYKKFDKKKTELEAGDIIVFNRDSMIVIHRIIKKYNIYGEEVYQTKGDANKSADNWTVKREDIVGTVEMKIPLIAWPSVILNTKY